MEKHEMICICCPRGCYLTVTSEDGDIKEITGNRCRRGETYAKEELISPVRVVTTTVRLNGGKVPMLPVKTSKAIPKPLIFDCIDTMRDISVSTPVSIGDVIIPNVLGTGADIIATRSIGKKDGD
mgnify:CR=1 FL=1